MQKALPIILLSLFVVSDNAHAYLDPGSGHLIWQYVLSMLLGGMFFFGRGIQWIKTGFKRLFGLFSKRKPESKNSNAEA